VQSSRTLRTRAKQLPILRHIYPHPGPLPSDGRRENRPPSVGSDLIPDRHLEAVARGRWQVRCAVVTIEIVGACRPCAGQKRKSERRKVDFDFTRQQVAVDGWSLDFHISRLSSQAVGKSFTRKGKFFRAWFEDTQRALKPLKRLGLFNRPFSPG